MAIEELYPYAIMGYSAFVTILAVYLWKLTNLNVDGTRHNIEKQVATAVVDIGAKVDAKLEAFEMPDLSPIMAKMTALEESVPDFDGEELMAKLNAIETGLPDMVGTHIQMAIKGVQAAEGKVIAQYVESLGIEGITEEAKEAAIEKLSLKQKAAYQLMTLKIPKKTRTEHPLSSQVFEQSRGFIAQAIIEHDEMGGNGNVTIDNGGSGSHRPGFRR